MQIEGSGKVVDLRIEDCQFFRGQDEEAAGADLGVFHDPLHGISLRLPTVGFKSNGIARLILRMVDGL